MPASASKLQKQTPCVNGDAPPKITRRSLYVAALICALLVLLSVGFYATFVQFEPPSSTGEYLWQPSWTYNASTKESVRDDVLSATDTEESGKSPRDSSGAEEEKKEKEDKKKSKPSVKKRVSYSRARLRRPRTPPTRRSPPRKPIRRPPTKKDTSKPKQADTDFPSKEELAKDMPVGTDGPLGCKVLAEYKSYVESEEKLPSRLRKKIIVDWRPSLHVLRLVIPNCGQYFFKLSCRPTLSYFWGRQEWPEIVGHELDKALGFELTYPTIGFMLPMDALFPGRASRVAARCVFTYNNDRVLTGALMRSEKFVPEAVSWYRSKCSKRDITFMKDVFKLALLDYFLLNTDRHMTKNWFREGDKVVAADNGAWSFHDHNYMCDQEKYLEGMLYPIEVFRGKMGKRACPVLENSERPICELVKLVRHTNTLNAFLSSSTGWKKSFEEALVNDQWFATMPRIMHKRGLVGVELMGEILSRNMSNCHASINNVGVSQGSDVGSKDVIRFVSGEISARLALAQKTVHKCLETGL
eukprot:gb/GECG01013535.1/.p1 GENE.gb/GECG01013535.1/~~gb/GECG01013535.1/.p1  ORF type:complete len:527 (+),score=55.20 gb/GECG01013535.1/:1-1581(+)